MVKFLKKFVRLLKSIDKATFDLFLIIEVAVAAPLVFSAIAGNEDAIFQSAVVAFIVVTLIVFVGLLLYLKFRKH